MKKHEEQHPGAEFEVAFKPFYLSPKVEEGRLFCVASDFRCEPLNLGATSDLRDNANNGKSDSKKDVFYRELQWFPVWEIALFRDSTRTLLNAGCVVVAGYASCVDDSTFRLFRS